MLGMINATPPAGAIVFVVLLSHLSIVYPAIPLITVSSLNLVSESAIMQLLPLFSINLLISPSLDRYPFTLTEISSIESENVSFLSCVSLVDR